MARGILTASLIAYLEQRGFIRKGDPFYCTYRRGEVILCFDDEAPYQDSDFLLEDLSRQIQSANPADADLIRELRSFIESNTKAI